MLNIHFWFLVVVGISCVADVAVSEESENTISAALKVLPEEDKEDFLAYALGLGLLEWARNQPRPPKFVQNINENIFLSTLQIPEERLKTFKEMKITPESREKLLHWTEKEFHLTTKDVLQLIRTKKCQGSDCTGLGDLWPLCCPW